MWVKDVSTGKVADLPVEQVRAWPGGYVPVPKPETKPVARRAEKASVEAEEKEATDG